ncbi:MAG: ABC transporter permease [Synergistaceae bacterium]|nr:ABC transporter permease [Synergistaceae bacterium]
MKSLKDRNKIKIFLKQIFIFALIFVLWEFVTRKALVSSFVLPSPEQVYETFIEILQNGELISNIVVSLRRLFTGFGISCGITFILVILAVLSPALRSYFQGILTVLRHTPPLSLIPLLILWLGIGEAPKITVIVLATLFPILLNTEHGIFYCDKKLIEVGQIFGFSRKKIFFKIMLPSALPEILLGLCLGIGYAWRAIISAELIAATSGIGYMILDARAMARTDKVIAGVLVIAVLGVVTDFLTQKLVKIITANR